MNSDNNKIDNHSDGEVEFEPLIVWFLSIMTKIALFFRKLGFSIRKGRMVVLLFVAIGLIAASGIMFLAKKKYVVKMTLKADNIDNHTCYVMIRDLSLLSFDNSFNKMAEILEIEVEDAERIKAVSYKNINNTLVTKEDTLITNRNFFVTVELLEPTSNVKLYENAVVKYLKKNEYGMLRKSRRSAFLHSKISWIKDELLRLDSLKSIIAQSIIPRSKAQGIIFGQPIDPMSIQNASENLHNQLIMYETELNTMSNIYVVKGFVLSEKPTYPRWNIYWEIGLIAIALGALYSVVMFYSDYEKRI